VLSAMLCCTKTIKSLIDRLYFYNTTNLRLKKKIHKLQTAGTNHYRLLGISSRENDYRLSWAINKALGSNFRKAENFISGAGNKNSEKLEFSLFQFRDDEVLKMNLISNRCPDGFLVRELKNIDFFLQIFGEDTKALIDSILSRIRSLDIVLAVFNIPEGIIKDTWNLPAE
jgi:hypothetical protein